MTLISSKVKWATVTGFILLVLSFFVDVPVGANEFLGELRPVIESAIVLVGTLFASWKARESRAAAARMHMKD
jgi:hypothetical protein